MNGKIYGTVFLSKRLKCNETIAVQKTGMTEEVTENHYIMCYFKI